MIEDVVNDEATLILFVKKYQCLKLKALQVSFLF